MVWCGSLFGFVPGVLVWCFGLVLLDTSCQAIAYGVALVVYYGRRCIILIPARACMHASFLCTTVGVCLTRRAIHLLFKLNIIALSMRDRYSQSQNVKGKEKETCNPIRISTGAISRPQNPLFLSSSSADG